MLRQLSYQPWLHQSVISWNHFHTSPSVSLPPGEALRCQGLRYDLMDLLFSLPVVLLCTSTGLKCTRQGAITPRAPLYPKLNTALAVCSLVCCRLLQPGDNCIAVSPWLMSCQCNCFTVWPLVFQTRALVKDLHGSDERWASVCVCVCGCWWQDKYVSPLMLCVTPESSVIYLFIFLLCLKVQFCAQLNC